MTLGDWSWQFDESKCTLAVESDVNVLFSGNLAF